MGRQITVDLVPLMRAGCKIRVLYNGSEQSWLVVKLPDGRVINSDAEGCLSFDCRHMVHVSQRLDGVLAARQQRPVRKGLTSLAGLGNMARTKINRGRQNVQVPVQAIRPQAI